MMDHWIVSLVTFSVSPALTPPITVPNVRASKSSTEISQLLSVDVEMVTTNNHLTTSVCNALPSVLLVKDHLPTVLLVKLSQQIESITLLPVVVR